MNSVTVEELVMRIEIELDKFRSQSAEAERLEKRLRSSLKETKQSADGASESFDALGESVGESNKELVSKAKTIVNVTKRLVGFFAVITGSNAVHRFVSGISNANDQLNFLSQRLGMSARDIKGIDTAIVALGGANASAINSIVSLNQGIQEMVLMGNDALIPFFSAMGVSVVDASGAVREMDDILLDMSDSLSRMDPRQAYALANAMGLDEGVTNALIQGREAMQDMLDLHKQIYVSTQAELDASRELSKAQALLSAQWQGLKTIIANMLTPALLSITKLVSGWVDYLNRNERYVKAFFVGISTAIGIVLLPMLTKAAIAVIAFMSPFLLASLAVAALGAAIGLLYDDYKVWAAGGKSLFDWGEFVEYISSAELSVDNLKNAFARLLTGYNDWEEASKGFKAWLENKGLVDENGIAIRNLGSAFRELGRDILNASPVLQSIVATIDHLTSGRWGDAAREVAKLPALMLRGSYDFSSKVAEHGASVVDVLLGHDPDEEGSFADFARRGTATRSNQISDALGLERTREEPEPKNKKTHVRGLNKKRRESIATTAEQLGMDPNDLATVISFETAGTFNPGIKNPKSSATGLIQKMRDPDGKYYGYSRDELASMSFEEQMEKVVLRYFEERGFSADNPVALAQIYEAVAGSGYKKGSQAYELNKVWDTNKDGVIDRHEAVKSPEFQAHIRDYMGSDKKPVDIPRSNESITNKNVDIDEKAAKKTTGTFATDLTAASIDTFKRLIGMQDKVALKTPTSNNSRNVSVSVGNVTVNTTASTLPSATAEGVAAGIERSSGLLDQLGGGI